MLPALKFEPDAKNLAKGDILQWSRIITNGEQMNSISWIKQTILLLAVLPIFYNCSGPMSYIHPTADLTYIKSVDIRLLKI